MPVATMVSADQPDFTDGVMVALYPSQEVAQRYARYGRPADDMHVTIAYLGHVDEVDRQAAVDAVAGLPARMPFTATVSGHARFTGGESDVMVALVDSPMLEALRNDVVAALDKYGVWRTPEHGFTAHMTLAYVGQDEMLPVHRIPPEDVVFDTVYLVYGTERMAFPMMNDTAESMRVYARTAYAQGWAASGGPMTDVVMAGCSAAMDLCSENWREPNVLEVALHLGHLEGVWAQVFHRRDRMIADHTKEVRRIWRDLTADSDVAGAVTLFRQSVGLDEARRSADWIRRAKQKAREAAMRILQWLTGKSGWQTLRDALREVVIAGRAEGYASAIAITAAEQSALGFDWDIAFQHAYDALENLGDAWAAGDVWLERMLGRAADEFGRTLGDLASMGADYEQMIAAGLDVLQDTTEDADVVGFIVDWALSTGMSRGALDLYASEGVQQVTWMTAGDGRVCPTCETNGEGSPWLITDFPQMPAHPNCRCVASADFDLSGFGAFFN